MVGTGEVGQWLMRQSIDIGRTRVGDKAEERSSKAQSRGQEDEQRHSRLTDNMHHPHIA